VRRHRPRRVTREELMTAWRVVSSRLDAILVTSRRPPWQWCDGTTSRPSARGLARGAMRFSPAGGACWRTRVVLATLRVPLDLPRDVAASGRAGARAADGGLPPLGVRP